MIWAIPLKVNPSETERPPEMSDPDDALLLADELAQPVEDSSEVDRIVSDIQAANKSARWKRDVKIKVGDKRWRPSAVAGSRESILYVCLRTEVPRYISSRLVQAFSNGLSVHVALPLDALFNAETLELLASVDANVFVINESRTASLCPLHFMAAMADLGVPVEPSLRAKIGTIVWSRITNGTPQDKGRRLEALLAVLFSQIADLRVVERNFRTETQEIDLVLQIDNFSPRIWQHSGPLMLVEAKNTAERTPQHVVSLFIHKIRTKRGSCKVGLLISTAGFTTDAELEELRISESDNCVVMLDGDKLLKLIQTADLDEALETFVRRAMLR